MCKNLNTKNKSNTREHIIVITYERVELDDKKAYKSRWWDTRSWQVLGRVVMSAQFYWN